MRDLGGRIAAARRRNTYVGGRSEELRERCRGNGRERKGVMKSGQSHN
jgi:hypothetical protein